MRWRSPGGPRYGEPALSQDTPIEVDARGLVCPLPILRLAQAVRPAEGGALFHLVGSDPAILPDVRAWCESTGHTLVKLGEGAGTYEAWIRKAGG